MKLRVHYRNDSIRNYIYRWGWVWVVVGELPACFRVGSVAAYEIVSEKEAHLPFHKQWTRQYIAKENDKNWIIVKKIFDEGEEKT